MKKPKAKKQLFYFFGIIVLVTVIFFISVDIRAESPIKTKEGKIDSFFILSNNLSLNNEYFSKVYQSDFDFNAIGLESKIFDKNIGFYIRTYDNNWSSWQKLESSGYFKNETDKYLSEPNFVSPSKQFQYKIVFNDNVNFNSSKITIYYLNTEEQKSDSNLIAKVFRKLVVLAQTEISVISRANWGADESYRLDSSGNVLWPGEYEPIKKFVIHHTAGSNGGTDPAATVRGIYYWHAIVRGWGDIGYNYLVDPNGNIYEGRYGGDGVVGGHAFDEIKNVSYNYGTIGISVLGNYETTDTLSEAARNSLTNLVAVKSRDLGVIPNGSGVINGSGDLPNIIGHRDLEPNLCPGQNIYNLLPQIRKEAQTKYAALTPLPAVVTKAATFISQSDSSLTVKTGETAQITVTFRNDGNTAWRSYVSDMPYLMVGATSPIKDSSWISDTQVAHLDTPNVAPGETGNFVFKIKAPNDYVHYTENFFLKWGDDVLANTSFNLSLTVTGLEYAANSFSHNILPATFPNTLKKVVIQYTNMGIKTWNKNNVFLYVTDENGKKSPYYNKWPDNLGKISFSQTEVKSQETATFTFYMKSPNQIGNLSNYFTLKRTDGTEITGSQSSVASRVDSAWQAKMQSQNIPVAVLDIWKVPVTLKIKNNGLTTWDKNVVLNVYDGDYRNSSFSSEKWPNERGGFTFSETKVKPGQYATFKLTLYSPPWPGTYYTIFKLEYKGKNNIVIQGDYRRLIRVDPAGLDIDSYAGGIFSGSQAEYVSISAPPAMLKTKKGTVEVKIKNTGTTTWQNNVVLNVYDADLRESYFRDTTWSTFSGGIHFREKSVKPGQTATFRFVFKAPYQTGLYRNRFKLAIETKEYLIIPGFDASWLTRVD